MSFDPVFRSRRSDVRGTRGMVATSQPLAAEAALDTLRRGGSAADAAVVAGAMLSVTEPVSTGPGGDAFALVYEAATGKVHALNGSGRSAAATSREELRRLMYSRMPTYTAHTVTVPGAVAAWADLLDRFGRMSLADALAPAIRAAEEGFPVTDWIAYGWSRQRDKLLRAPGWGSGDIYNGPEQASGRELLLDGRAPRAGELMRIPTLGGTLREIAAGGPDAFYRGEFASKMAAHVQRYGGWIAEEDLAAHASEWTEPIAVPYGDVTLFECPPNGQGLAASIAAGVADGFDFADADEADRQHLLVEAMRIGFADAFRHVADPAHADLPVDGLLDPAYLAERREGIDPERAARAVPAGPRMGDDTVYVSVVDGDGNAVSFIQSLYMGTGTGLVVPGTGVSLQNRGAGFSFDESHPNAVGPGKRPYHTIIPALTTRAGHLHACFGVMGGDMQPQGHLQVLGNLLDRKMTPQAALDAPRWRITWDRAPDPAAPLHIEDGFARSTMEMFAARGHRPRVVTGAARIGMGGGQVIERDPESGILTGGSDPRKDGAALGY
ncbi:MAG: gamma-glutamyltransferase family protein [Planctomycetota bacterium]